MHLTVTQFIMSTAGVNNDESVIKSLSHGTLYDAGGGMGRSGLSFGALQCAQDRMFGRTIYQLSGHDIRNRDQELRQLIDLEGSITIHVTIAREDFPAVSAVFKVTYIPSNAQLAWNKLLDDVVKKLKVDFIYSIVDRNDKSPVSRVLRLRDGGEYYVRQREASAILDVLNTGNSPVEVSWDITMHIDNVKKDLSFSLSDMPVIDKRVAGMVSKKITRAVQIDLQKAIMESKHPSEAVSIMRSFHESYHPEDNTKLNIKEAVLSRPLEEDLRKEELFDRGKKTPESKGGRGVVHHSVAYRDVAKYDRSVDIVSLHRLVLETLRRFVTRGRVKAVAKEQCFEYVEGVINELRHEVDIVSMGLKLLSDIMKYLVQFRESLLHLILNCIQAYAPPPGANVKRDPARLRAAEDAYSAFINATNKTTPTKARGVDNNKSIYGKGLPGKAADDSPTAFNDKATTDDSLSRAVQMDGCAQRYGDFYGQSAPDLEVMGNNSIQVTLNSHQVAEEVISHINSLCIERERESKLMHSEVQRNARSDMDSLNPPIRGQLDSEVVSDDVIGTSDSIVVSNNDLEVSSHAQKGSGIGGDGVSKGAAIIVKSNRSKRISPYAFKLKRPTDRDREDSSDAQNSISWKGSMGEIGRYVLYCPPYCSSYCITISHHLSALRKAPLKAMEQQFDSEFKKTKPSDSGGRPQLDATPAAPVADGSTTAGLMAANKEGTEVKVSQASGLDGIKAIVDAVSGGLDQAITVRPDSGKQTVSGDHNNGSPDLHVDNDIEGVGTRDNIPTTSNSSHQKHRKKRTKTAFQPLPVVDCVIFRGATGKMKQRLALTQSFATLFKMMSQNYGNRALALKLGVVEEISVIAVVCQDMPRVLDYFIWIVDVLYRDGFGDYLTPEDLEVLHCV